MTGLPDKCASCLLAMLSSTRPRSPSHQGSIKRYLSSSTRFVGARAQEAKRAHAFKYWLKKPTLSFITPSTAALTFASARSPRHDQPCALHRPITRILASRGCVGAIPAAPHCLCSMPRVRYYFSAAVSKMAQRRQSSKVA